MNAHSWLRADHCRQPVQQGGRQRSGDGAHQAQGTQAVPGLQGRQQSGLLGQGAQPALVAQLVLQVAGQQPEEHVIRLSAQIAVRGSADVVCVEELSILGGACTSMAGD